MKSSFFSVGKSFKYGKRLRPSRDWLILLGLFFVLLLVSVAWNLWQFSRSLDGQQIGNAAPPPPEKVQLTSLSDVFSAREAERAKYQTEYQFVDPSL